MTSIENGVLTGFNGQLFLVGGAHSVLDYATGALAVEPASIDNFWRNITSRSNLCRARGIRYLHVLFPDKQAVLESDFPAEVNISLGKVYCEAAPPQAPYIFPLNELKSADEAAFLKLDTHLTDKAALIVIQAALRAIGIEATADVRRVQSKITGRQTYEGDLGSKLKSKPSDCKETLAIDWPTIYRTNSFEAGNDGIIDLFFSKGAIRDERVLIFGDSFFRMTLSHLSYFFKEICFMRTRFFHEEIVQAFKPDIVLTGNVERYLSDVKLDEEAPQALLYPFVLGKHYAPGKEFVAAMNAVLSFGRKPYADFMKTLEVGT